MPTGSTAVMPERVANSAIGSRAAALHQNILLAAKSHDIPDDQEVAGQIEFLDQRQFALDLLAHAPLAPPSPPHPLDDQMQRGIHTEIASPRGCARAEIHLRIAIRHGIFGKLITQIVQRKLQTRGKNLRYWRWLREDRKINAPFPRVISHGARNCAPAGARR